ncbi:hypothetical protein TNCV_2074671 [Trichonephila clavipes]|nr:hypothetical protein TNCV_2074671 [Trichonephila clavipes]
MIDKFEEIGSFDVKRGAGISARRVDRMLDMPTERAQSPTEYPVQGSLREQSKGTFPGIMLEIKCDRGSALARLTSGHLTCLSFDGGRKNSPHFQKIT